MFSWPRSCRIMIAVLTIALLCEAMRKIVSWVIAAPAA
jgi:hypothetical protein